MSILHQGLISFLELGPPLVGVLDNFDDFMLRKVRMITILLALDAICWVLEMIEALLFYALVEDLLSFARALFSTRFPLPLGLRLIRSGHFNYYIFKYYSEIYE